jgi:hypothetical protein
MTSAGYLTSERAAETKSEFFDGEPFAIELRAKVGANRLPTYPDFVVVCGEQRFEEDQLDTLTKARF